MPLNAPRLFPIVTIAVGEIALVFTTVTGLATYLPITYTLFCGCAEEHPEVASVSD